MEITMDNMPSAPTNAGHRQKTNNRRARSARTQLQKRINAMQLDTQKSITKGASKAPKPCSWWVAKILALIMLRTPHTMKPITHLGVCTHLNYNSQYWTNKPLRKLTAMQNTEYTSTKTPIAQGKQTFAQGKQAFEQARKKQARKKQASEPRQEQASNQAGQANKQKQTQDKTQDKTDKQTTANHIRLCRYILWVLYCSRSRLLVNNSIGLRSCPSHRIWNMLTELPWHIPMKIRARWLYTAMLNQCPPCADHHVHLLFMCWQILTIWVQPNHQHATNLYYQCRIGLPWYDMDKQIWLHHNLLRPSDKLVHNGWSRTSSRVHTTSDHWSIVHTRNANIVSELRPCRDHQEIKSRRSTSLLWTVLLTIHQLHNACKYPPGAGKIKCQMEIVRTHAAKRCVKNALQMIRKKNTMLWCLPWS